MSELKNLCRSFDWKRSAKRGVHMSGEAPTSLASAPPVASRAAVLAFCGVLVCSGALPAASTIPKWDRFEKAFESKISYANPAQEANLQAVFVAPSGETKRIYGFWDGASTWRIRFAPDQEGRWTYKTICSDEKNGALNGQTGEFTCVAPTGKTRFRKHGPVQLSSNQRYLMHQDTTPFFWLGDTAWNGALLSTTDEWDLYIKERTRQKFSAVQWVATQFRAAPDGDRNHQLAFTGPTNKIVLNPAFFQRLDQKVEALDKAGLVSVPVLLWAYNGGANPQVNPGVSLPEDQAILLARYMVARWGGNDVIWILAGDGDYQGEKAERWKRIGRAVFGNIAHTPVTMHPRGMQWIWDEFKDEPWYRIAGYQSGHGDDDKTLQWLTDGPLAEYWTHLPHRPFINLEPPYENQLGYQSRKPHTPESVRRAIYWSLLNAPTAGVTYGGHGVWGWDDGSKPPIDHPNTGTPLPWQKALTMPGAEQMKYLYDFFTTNDFWRLRPAPIFVVNQPGADKPAHFVAAARSDEKDVMIVYVPEDRTIEIKLDSLPPSPSVTWINPRTGENSPAVAVVTTSTCQFPTPSEGDWLLVMRTQTEQEKQKGTGTPTGK